jgi:hypothetical protein
VAVLAILVATPARLSGEPTTANAKSTSTATTTTTKSPTLDDLPDDTPPNPLTLYPHRPGARYDDVELRPTEALWIASARVRIVRWTIAPHESLPRGSQAADPERYQRLGLVDGYAPWSADTRGDILHVVVHVKQTVFPAALTCDATLARDGMVLLPFAPPKPKGTHPTSSTTTTQVPSFRNGPATVAFDLPIGSRRGRVYFTCRDTVFPSTDASALGGLLNVDNRAVWGIDV